MWKWALPFFLLTACSDSSRQADIEEPRQGVEDAAPEVLCEADAEMGDFGLWPEPADSAADAGVADATAPDAEVATSCVPSDEICNGLDDNCNGEVDETFAGKGDACETIQGCSGRLACRDGHEVCLGPDLAEEICNGKDDDCDGSVDEELVGELVQPQQGLCTGYRMTCAGQDGWRFPTIPGYEVDEENTCDHLDNDCDGTADEGQECPFGWRTFVVHPGRFSFEGREFEQEHFLLVWQTELPETVWDSILQNLHAASAEGDFPKVNVSFIRGAEWLNALSRRHGLPECYELRGNEAVLAQDCLGWRFPTGIEWTYVSYLVRENRRGNVPWNESFWLSWERVAWFADNSGGHIHPIAQLLPHPYDPFNHFDWWGNASEWIEEGAACGGAFDTPLVDLPHMGCPLFPFQWSADFLGMRPVRTIPPRAVDRR